MNEKEEEIKILTAPSDEESEIDSIDLFMESYVNLEQLVDLLAKDMKTQTELILKISEKIKDMRL